MTDKSFTIVIADDHLLVRNGLTKIIESYKETQFYCANIIQASNGSELITILAKLPSSELPDIALVDLNMPTMDGFETIQFLHTTYPKMRLLVLTFRNDEDAIIRSLRLGACGFLMKDAETEELKEAIYSALAKGYYYSEYLTKRLVGNILTEKHQTKEVTPASVKFSETELTFLSHVCSEKTYSEIAEEMSLTARTIEAHRNNLFSKLHVTTRVGLALWAVRNGIVSL